MLRLERRYKDPAPPEDREAVEALRRGALVLMGAAVESYLDAVSREQIALLSSNARLSLAKLPEDTREKNITETLKRAKDGAPFSKSGKRWNRLAEIKQLCGVLIADALYPEAFSVSGADSKAIQGMFQNLGQGSAPARVNKAFANRWPSAVHARYGSEKLDEIVGHRHTAAHTTGSMAVSRDDLKMYVKFLRIYVEAVEVEVRRVTRHLIKTAC